MIVEVQSNIMEIEECFDYEKDFLEYKKYVNYPPLSTIGA